jgi:hypothetical protein
MIVLLHTPQRAGMHPSAPYGKVLPETQKRGAINAKAHLMRRLPKFGGLPPSMSFSGHDIGGSGFEIDLNINKINSGSD